ncbi:phage tail length tape measure family protein [Dyella amyloliquefaciens]|uniref:phage tail length tape measure family protein n=1 Tax=Dyella amyloliquefaciens TaxID=1770545 RepID=UPI00102E3A80|nr:phage tail length tape measure family protein [Dyella amyloliquefaciens]
MGTITENTLRVKIEGTTDGSLKATLDGATQSTTALDQAQQGQAKSAADAAAAQLALGTATAQSAAQATTATTALGESSEAASARIKAMVAASVEQQAATSGIALSERALAEAAGKRVELTAAQTSALRTQIEASNLKVAADHALLASEAEATAAMVVATKSNDEQAAHFGVNSRSMSEAATILSDVISGQYGRIQRSGAALANSSGLIATLLTPTGLALAGFTATVGLLATGFLEAAEQESALEQAIIRSGNAAGQTADQVKQMAAQYATFYTNQRQVLNLQQGLMASGAVTTSTFKLATEAAVAFGEATGESQKQIIQTFDELSKDPLQTLQKIDALYGNITPEVLDHVKALQEEGDKAGSVATAYQAIIDAMRNTAAAEHDQESLIDRLIQRWKNGAASIADATSKLFTGKSPMEQFQMARQDYEAHLQSTQRNSPLDRLFGQVYTPEQLEAERQQVQAMADAIQKARDQAAQAGQTSDDNRLGAQADAYYDQHFAKLDKIRAKQQEINDLTATYEQMWEHTSSSNPRLAGVQRVVNADGSFSFSGGQYDRDLAGINDKYKQRKGPKDPEVAAYATFSGQVDALDVKSISADDAALTQYEQGIARLADEMGVYMSKGGDATKAADLFNRGQQALQKTLDANRQKELDGEKEYAAALDKSNAALQQQMDSEVAHYGMGDKEYAQQQKINKAYQDEAEAMEKLALQRQAGIDGKAGGLSEDAYQADVAALQRATQQKVQIIQNGYAQMDAAQSDWTNGAKTALQNYVDQARDSADYVKDAFGGLNNDLEDGLADFAQSGKVSFASFEKDFDNMLAHMAAKALIAEGESALLSFFGGGSSGFNSLGGSDSSYSNIGSDGSFGGNFNFASSAGGRANGGPIDGPGTATSDSILMWGSRGEYMQPKDAVDYYGSDFMDAVRSKRLPRHASGGMIGGGDGTSGSSGAAQVVVNIHGAPEGTQTQESQDGNGNQVIDVFLAQVAQNVMKNGVVGQAISRTFGVRRSGRSYAPALSGG